MLNIILKKSKKSDNILHTNIPTPDDISLSNKDVSKKNTIKTNETRHYLPATKE
jgi:hypothetical protein